METVDKIHEQKWKERREYDTWHHNYMERAKEKILEEMSQNERQQEYMKQFKLGWTEIQIKSINDHINLHKEYLKEEQEKVNAD